MAAAHYRGDPGLTPRRVWGTNESGERISKDQMHHSLPYVDVESGMNRRLVTRDPITGLGDLPAERDTLAGSHINHRPQWDAASRDPIAGTGHLGDEYNCMYSTKDSKKMRPIAENPTSDRNPILMEGYLGLELDPMRPHGGRPRNHNQRDANRNPISGTGDFGPKEWDPIYKYRGRMRRSRTAHSEIRRDPICGTGQFAPCEGDALGRPGRRSRSAVSRAENQDISPRNPITHVKNPDLPRTPPNEPRARGDPRDPILGEGFRRKEMMDLWLTPENYCFRAYLLPQGKHKQPEPEVKREPPKKPAKKILREPKKPKPAEPKEDTSTPKKEPTKKKLSAPKKQPLKKKEKDKDEQVPEKKILKGKKAALKSKKADSAPNGEVSKPTENDIDQKENEAPDRDIDQDSIDDHSQGRDEKKDIMEDSLTVGGRTDTPDYQEGANDDRKFAETNSTIMVDSLENANVVTGDTDLKSDHFGESAQEPIAEEEPETGDSMLTTTEYAEDNHDRLPGTDADSQREDATGFEEDFKDDGTSQQFQEPGNAEQKTLDSNDIANDEDEIEEW